jgi:L-threonate 2-dehydrogenase
MTDGSDANIARKAEPKTVWVGFRKPFMPKANKVGFVGLGAMGMGMATQLLKKGFQVAAVDTREEVKPRWTAAGGEWCESPADAAIDADVFVAMVVNAEQIESVLFSEKGAIKNLRPKSVIVATSTVSPAFSRALGKRLDEAGYLFIDAPVSGGVVGAESGGLSIMASGSDEAFAIGEPVLQAMAAKIYRIGTEPGLGSIVKTVNQLLAGSHIALAAEAMAFGTRAGVDPQVLFDVISHSAGSSWMFNNRVPHMLTGDFTPLSAVNIFVKDLGIVLDVAHELRFPLPMAAIAHQLFLGAAAMGLGNQDDASVVKLFENLSGVSVAQGH